MSRQQVAIRADGNSQIGLGHIYRAIALIEMLKDEFECHFYIRNPDQNIFETIGKVCATHVIDENLSYEAELEMLRNEIDEHTILILDGYQFDSRYQKKAKSFVKSLIAIDDNAAIYFYADLVINHGNASLADDYRGEAYTTVLNGFSYAIIRNEFIKAAKTTRNIERVENLFICLGGSDPFNITNRILKIALEIPYLKKIAVVTGSAYLFGKELESITKGANKPVVHKSNIAAKEMIDMINACQIAISTASTVAMEICSVKAGLIVGTVVDNQQAIYKQMIESKCALGSADFRYAIDEEIREKLHQLNNVALVSELMTNQARAIDGYSGQRIIEAIKKIAN